MRDRRIRGAAGRGPDPPRGARPPGVPRLRLGGHRRVHALRARRSARRKAGSPTSPRTSRRASRAAPGIGHTRWATHGEPTDENAHPQVDAAQRIAVVHNGIIENADELRAKLSADGVEFVSQTDTETVAHLIAKAFADGATDLEQAVRQALRSVVGAYGLAVMDAEQPDRIVVARNGSPVLLGIGEKEMFVASDVAALIGYTRQVVYLDDGELATHHRERLPHLHDRRPLDGQEPVHDRLGRRRRRDRRPRALPHQGDRRAAAHDRARVLRPHRRALRHRPARRPQPRPSARPARSSA